MKSKKGCMKKGGHIIMGGDYREGGDDKEDDITKLATGGAATHKKATKARSVVKVHGHKSMPRADKKARGGKVATPKSPLTGAMPSGLPGGGKGEGAPSDKEND